MAALTHPTLRQWLSFGSGCGVVMGDNHLDVTAVALRPTGVRLAGEMRVERYRERPAAEWGGEVAKFLAACGLKHVPVLVVLPRESVLVRTLTLAGVSDTDAAGAIQFQLDGMHPFAEEEAVHDWKRLENSAHFLVAIAERRVVDETVTLFTEAGLRLQGVTVSASVFHTAVRLLGVPPAAGLLAAPGLEAGIEGGLEVYGESPARPIYSGVFEMEPARAAALAASELRLDEGAELRDVLEYLPRLNGAPAGYDFSGPARSRGAFAYAAAVAAACPHLGEPVNLLPPELRTVTSRMRYIPTAALGLVLLVCGAALAMQGGYEDRKYLSLVQGQVRRLETPARRVETADKEMQAMVERIALLDEFRSRPKQDLDALLELTRLIPQNGFSSGLSMTRDQIVVGGEAEQAEGLLKAFDASPLFEASEFSMPLSRTQSGLEVFRVRTNRTPGVRP